jgi:Mn2+/Fe2+ NRAMP family transporter
MGRIFIGKPLHWVLIVLLIAIGWVIGHERLHVIWFNLFTVILLVISAVAVAVVLLTSRPEERITRDPLESDGD